MNQLGAVGKRIVADIRYSRTGHIDTLDLGIILVPRHA